MDAVIQNIFSVVIGGAIAIFGNYFIEKYKSEKKTLENKMVKLEELFNLTDLMQREVLTYPSPKNNKFIGGGLSINIEGFNPAKMSMLVRFYFPSILEDYKLLALKYVEIHSKFNDVEIVDKEIDDFHKTINKFYTILENESQKLMEKI